MTKPITVSFLLHDTARLLRKRFEQNARDLGLTRSQYQALAYLARNEGIQQSCLADLLDVEPITLVRLIDKLEAQGLVERKRHPSDRRIWQLYTTPVAHPLLEKVFAIGELTRGEALNGISAEERQHLADILTTMKTNLLAVMEKPSGKSASAKEASNA